MLAHDLAGLQLGRSGGLDLRRLHQLPRHQLSTREAREVGRDNCEPWVRHHGRGQSVAWCQAFVSTIWADAARRRDDSTTLKLDGVSCLFAPRMVQEAKGRFSPARRATHADGMMGAIEGHTNQSQYGAIREEAVTIEHVDARMAKVSAKNWGKILWYACNTGRRAALFLVPSNARQVQCPVKRPIRSACSGGSLLSRV